MIPYGSQPISSDDIDAVARGAARRLADAGSGRSAGSKRRSSSKRAPRHAVAFANGTAALHGAVAVAGLGPGDVVATQPLTFMASANCARYVGATVELDRHRADT